MRIPTTILGGYLGSGKTTALNRLLANTGGRRIAVLVNDFGSVNIDADLIVSQDDRAISLTNGCVCCSIADDLGDALDGQTARPDRPDHIVVEASGVAETGRISTHVGNWPGIERTVTVCMADAETVIERADDKFVGALVRRQLAEADQVILNKLDLVSAEQLPRVRQWVARTAPRRAILEASHGAVPVDVLLGGAADRPEAVFPASEHPPHLHSTVWRPAAPVNLAALGRVLDSLPASIHRVKGFVADAATGAQCLVQQAGARRAINSAPAVAAPCLVLIGTCPPDVLARIKTDLDRCVAVRRSP